MPTKKIVQDIVPNERRSIRSISLEREEEAPKRVTRRKVAISKPVVVEEVEEEEEIAEPVRRPRSTSKKSGSSFKYVISFILILVSIGVIGIALSLSYSKAVVTITPKVVNLDINGTFTAKKSAPGEELSYEVVTASDSITETIAATKGPLVQTKAKGVATIYNNYSATPQTLVAGTRLADADGLVYRTTATVSVPGKKTTPGTIAVNIVADQAGEQYNMKTTEMNGDFKFLGYVGSPKYSGFYARLKTDVTGGFSGNKMTIDPAAKTAAVTAMQETLKAQLAAKLAASIPADAILYDEATSIEYETPEPVMKTATDAEITVKGVAYAAVFKSDAFIKFIAGKEIKKFPSDTYTIGGDKALDFKVSNIKDFSIKKGTPLIFTLKGPVSITGTLAEGKLKEELKGIKLKDGNAIFAKYPSIANAYTLITPFWMRSFPDTAEKITIEYK